MRRRASDDVIGARLPVVLDQAPAGGPPDHALHLDGEAICPRCLSWIRPDEYLRRNAIGLLQHESCPLELVAWRTSAPTDLAA